LLTTLGEDDERSPFLRLKIAAIFRLTQLSSETVFPSNKNKEQAVRTSKSPAFDNANFGGFPLTTGFQLIKISLCHGLRELRLTFILNKFEKQ
jgi:hypothetical protein